MFQYSLWNLGVVNLIHDGLENARIDRFQYSLWNLGVVNFATIAGAVTAVGVSVFSVESWGGEP